MTYMDRKLKSLTIKNHKILEQIKRKFKVTKMIQRIQLIKVGNAQNRYRSEKTRYRNVNLYINIRAYKHVEYKIFRNSYICT